MTKPSASSESRASAPRNHALDGLRGWAAMAVIYYHSILGPRPDFIAGILQPPLYAMHGTRQVLEKIVLSLLNGEVAVELFFVLSGLVLFRSLMNDRDPMPLVAVRFALRRFLRLWPPLALALVVNVLAFRLIDPFVGGQLVAFTGFHTLLSNLLLKTFGVNGATWTLHVEIFIVPLLLLVWAGTRLFGLLAVLALLAACFRPRWMAHLALHDIYVQATAYFFALGIAVERGLLNWLFRWRRLAGPIAAAALATLLLVTLLLPRDEHLRLMLQGGSLAVLVAYAFRTRDGAGIRFLESAPSQLVGRLSYSIYLWNVPIFEVLLALTPPWLKQNHTLETGLVVALATSVLVLPVAHLAERFVEQPCIDLGRCILRKRKAAPRATAAAGASAPALLAVPTDGA